MEPWRLGTLEAKGLEAWRLGVLEVWRLGPAAQGLRTLEA